MDHIEKWKTLYQTNEKQILQDFFTFLKFQSISSEPDHKEETKKCADWVVDFLKKIGFTVELWETGKHPIIFASYLKAGHEQPTLLIYNHYDVQPVDPLELWSSPPFEPAVRHGQVYARGAQDNKGQCFYTLQALKTMIETQGSLPINIKLCIEGEEECGSESLSNILEIKKEQLKADYLAIIDLGMRSLGQPSLTLGIRGIVTMDVELQGASRDAHSGCNGGLLYNPNHALVELLAKLRDREGKILVPGFYDEILPLSQDECKEISWTFDAKEYEKDMGAMPTGGEKNFQHLERNWIRPTLEINGISGGYSGAGFKTVIPAKASAKISCRLVPGQDPEKIGHLVAAFLEKNTPEGIRVSVNIHKGGTAVRSKADSKVVQAFAKAYTEVFGRPCEFILEGASIPIVTELAEACGAEVVLAGLGLQEDCIHAPDEHFGLDRLQFGYLTVIRALSLLSKKN